jgi:diguanylate cyclase (GGDEF)-like protein
MGSLSMQAAPTPIEEARGSRTFTTLRIVGASPEERFDRLTRLACRVFDVASAVITLVDRDRQWRKSQYGADMQGSELHVSNFSDSVLQTGPLVVEDRLRDIHAVGNLRNNGDRSSLFCAGHPVHGADGSRIGTLCLFDPEPREFDDIDAALLADIAMMVDREFSLDECGTTDEITRISTRKGFIMVANYILPICRRNRQSGAVISIDLDGFKTINDTYGHQGGDAVLRHFAKILVTHFREADVVARIGSDEFTVLCTGVTAEQVSVSLDRLRTEFTQSALSGAHPRLSWSAGVADFHPPSTVSIENLLRIADSRMLCEKSRNRLCL